MKTRGRCVPFGYDASVQRSEASSKGPRLVKMILDKVDEGDEVECRG